MTVIDYFFTIMSPYAYLGHDALRQVAGRHGAAINYRPYMIGKVFEATGGQPLGKRHPARQDYRWYELQRWREKRGLELTLKPAHFPTNPGLADCSAIAIAEAGGDPGDYLAGAFRAIWAEDLDIAETSVIGDILSRTGHDADDVMAAAQSDAIRATYEKNADDAITEGIVGSPGYVLNGEPFWGQDRLDMLEDALASGRAPYAIP